MIGNVLIEKNREIAPDIYEMIILSKKISEEGFPGEFVNLYLNDGEHLLPRPISICEVDKENHRVRLVYAVVGKGTEIISKEKEGDKIKVMGPLGNGFRIGRKEDRNIVIGGGIGTPPLLELVKNLKGKTKVYLGFRSNPILVKDFERLGAEVYIATEDGSVGYRGNILELLENHDIDGDYVYGCGPRPMLKALAEWCKKKDIPAQLSLEERMACGIGACLVCTCKINTENEEWENKRVCKDGPVFFRDEVIW